VSESLIEFFKSHPVLAILLILFVALPIAGAILHIVLKAFGRQGVDSEPTITEAPPIGSGENGAPSNEIDRGENRRPQS
jgi:hypothetical protein